MGWLRRFGLGMIHPSVLPGNHYRLVALQILECDALASLSLSADADPIGTVASEIALVRKGKRRELVALQIFGVRCPGIAFPYSRR